MTKTRLCISCKQSKNIDQFRKDARLFEGYTNKCKPCYRIFSLKDDRKYRDNHREKIRKKDRIRKKNVKKIRDKFKDKARYAVWYAVKTGKIIKPTTCYECGNRGKIHGHHEDYSKQLMVEWLCTICHGKRHQIDIFTHRPQGEAP